ncbi:MAG: helix-turn-helix transcriptional regulator [Longimicrobiales bacterium]
MSERITKLQRWLDLIAYLVGRRLPVPFEELMEKVPGYADRWRTEDETARATARRTFERDKDDLRKLGIPLHTVRYTINFGTEVAEGYRIERRDFYLPYLRLVSGARSTPKRSPQKGTVQEVELTEEEARLSLDALRRVANIPSFPLAREARSAFRKLAFDLDPTVFGAEVPVLFVDRPGAEELRDRLRVLSDALVARKRVRFRYHGMARDEETRRDVGAYGLLFQSGHWYLIGHDALRDGVRVFRVGRMDDVLANTRSPNTPDYEVPSDFRLDDHLRREPWQLGDHDDEPLRADVLFRFPSSLWAERNGHGSLVERRLDGSQIRRFDLYQVQPFLRWLLAFEGEAEPLAPSALRAELRKLATDIEKAHGGRGDADSVRSETCDD